MVSSFFSIMLLFQRNLQLPIYTDTHLDKGRDHWPNRNPVHIYHGKLDVFAFEVSQAGMIFTASYSHLPVFQG